ncbi:MAG: Y-family DNA polymerase [Planctomycetaceae bacterium]|jgi:DNA polymerase V|nr:Y-family DNA polymerase [Planctomycetaceae bacterium]
MFALVDCNSFFASCERLFRPDLIGKPVVVLSNNDGVVVARSKEAKQLGIAMGEPFFRIKQLAQQKRLFVFSSNFTLYSDLSRRVMHTLENFCPVVEIYSIDEAFLDLSGMAINDLNEFGHSIAATVYRWTGIPVSVGIAATKTLAKVANEITKNAGMAVYCLQDDAERIKALQKFDIGDVWGIGRRLVVSFRRLGLRSAYELSLVDPMWIRKNYSIVQEKTVRELCGETCFEVDVPQSRKSIQVSRSFGETISRFDELEEATVAFAIRAAENARADGTVASAVYVHVNTNRFKKNKEDYYSNGIAISFVKPTSNTMEIIAAVRNGLKRIFVPRMQYKKATVILLNLIDMKLADSQKFLFDKNESYSQERRETENRLMNSLDEINRKFGRRTVFFGVEGIHQPAWRAHRNMISPCYTTDINDLPVAK